MSENIKIKNDWVTERWMSQITNALATKYKVKIQQGKYWRANVESKTIEYTEDVYYMTTNDVLTLLIHEIGHILYTDRIDAKEMDKIPKKHAKLAKNFINAMEDIRIDSLMNKTFVGAEEITKDYHDSLSYRNVDGLLRYSEKTVPSVLRDFNKFNGYRYKTATMTSSKFGRGNYMGFWYAGRNAASTNSDEYTDPDDAFNKHHDGGDYKVPFVTNVEELRNASQDILNEISEMAYEKHGNKKREVLYMKLSDGTKMSNMERHVMGNDSKNLHLVDVPFRDSNGKNKIKKETRFTPEAQKRIDDYNEKSMTYSRIIQINERLVPQHREIPILSLLSYEGYINDGALTKYFDDEYNVQNMVKLSKKVADLWRKRDLEELGSTDAVTKLFVDEVYPMVLPHLVDIDDEFNENQNQIGTPTTTGISDVSIKGDNDSEFTEEDEINQQYRDDAETHNSIHGMTEKRLREEVEKAKGTKGYSAGVEKLHNFEISGSSLSYEKSLARVKQDVTKYKRRFEKKLKERRISRYGGRHRTGRINIKKIYKQRLDDPKLFQRLSTADKRNYAIAVSFDVSGSMGCEGRNGHKSDDPLYPTMDSAVLIEKVFSSLGAETHIEAYSDYGSVLKDINDDKVIPSKYTQGLIDEVGGGTDAVSSVVRCINKLNASKAENKILLLLTDGDWSYREVETIREHIQKTKADKTIKMYGVTVRNSIGGTSGVTETLKNFANKKNMMSVKTSRGSTKTRTDVINTFTRVIEETLN